jgi:hypothetical protein
LNQWEAVWEMTNTDGDTPLHVVADSEDGAVFLEFVASKLPNQLVSFLHRKDVYDHTPSHRAAQSKRGAAFLRTVVKSLTDNQLSDLLEEQNAYGQTLLYEVAEAGDKVEFLGLVAGRLPAKFVASMTVPRVITGQTISKLLEIGTPENDSLETMFDSLFSEEQLNQTPFALAIRAKSGVEFLRVIREKLPEKQLI